jgi:excisionase family DNA binding protein
VSIQTAALRAVADAATAGELLCSDDLLATVRAALVDDLPPRLLSPAEVALVLGVDVDTVRRLIRSRALVAVKLGYRTVRVTPADLAAYVADRPARP